MNASTHKQCRGKHGCGQTLPLSEFHNMTASKDGKTNVCKTCSIKAAKAWKEMNSGNQECITRRRRDPNGGRICEHGHVKYRCTDCGGKGTCSHGKLRINCLLCDGKNICEHGLHKTRCPECDPAPCMVEGCTKYGHIFAGKYSLGQHIKRYHKAEA